MKSNRGNFAGASWSVFARAIVSAVSALALAACGGYASVPASYTLSGTASGLTADGLVLVNNGTTMTLNSGAASFTFDAVYQTSQTYAVTAQGQPSGLRCSVVNGTGSFAAKNVSNVAVTCVPTYTVAGTVSGLTADGLVLANGSETLAVGPNAVRFAFATSFATTAAYAVAVRNSPSGLTCSVANGTGMFATANVDNVVVTCSAQSFALGGTIGGLTSPGLVLANGTDHLPVSSGATTFTLPAAVAYSSSYAVTVATQPQGLSCSVQNGTGAMGTAAVTNVAVACSNRPYTLGGTVSGLGVGGLVLANGNDTVQVAANASTFTLPAAVAFSTGYAVTVAAQPPNVTCSVSNGSGTMPAANVTAVVVVCSVNAFTIGGAISGLTNAGLVLAVGSDTLHVAANATGFTMPAAVAFGSHYQVTVATQPANSLCTVSNASGTMAAADVTNVAVTCARAYTLGGSISGLTATDLILTDGTDNLSVAANAAIFSMPTGVAAGSSYSVSVAAQPAGLICTLTGGSGVMPAANVSSVQVACVAREWTWETGSKTIGSEGSYGSVGVVAPANVPSERDSAMNWTDKSGRLWLFGGSDQSSGRGGLDDLWMFDPVSQLWVWMKGPSTANSPGSYGVQGVAAASNVPPARGSGVTWVDSAGHLWLFGGGAGDPGLSGYLNDLWMYDTGTNNWTWVGGTNAANDPGSYGTQGVAAAGNTPPARLDAAVWVDAAGHFWLYSGQDAAGTLSDLWMYDPGTNLWTWVNGSNTALNVAPAFGTLGVAAADNTPGSRHGTAIWTDGSGHLWLFGGVGDDSSGSEILYGDTWSYNIASNQWTWMGGSNTGNATGTYGTLGIGSAGNSPGARYEMASCTDNAGRFWMFGGVGYGDGTTPGNWLADLWMFDPVLQQWTWVKGPSFASNDGGVYGTQGTPAPNNVPGGRVFPLCWVDSGGSLWMFGGYGPDANASRFDENDLWKF